MSNSNSNGWTNKTNATKAEQIKSSADVTEMSYEDWRATTPKCDTVRDIKDETIRLYAVTKAGYIDPTMASKMGYLLDLGRRMIETSDIEKRLEALEGGK